MRKLSAAIYCLERNIPFVYYILPSGSSPCFWANPSYDSCKRKQSSTAFFITPWLKQYADSLFIHPELTADEIIDSGIDFSKRYVNNIDKCSTDYNGYIENVENIISRLKERGGKTVFSKILCGSMKNVDIEQFVNLQFKLFSKTFRFLYYTPDTGAWIGTSPEILLDLSLTTGKFRTMSLAGTKVIDDSKSWDCKNINEQNLVVGFIASILDDYSIKYELNRCADVEFKPVCHICDIFTGTMSPNLYPELLDRLSPTPALGGFPVKEALADISQLERHERRCYGGYVGCLNDEKLIAYVNLRCMNFSLIDYCIYSGGGITAQSNACDEWVETDNKTKILRQNLAAATHKS